MRSQECSDMGMRSQECPGRGMRYGNEVTGMLWRSEEIIR